MSITYSLRVTEMQRKPSLNGLSDVVTLVVWTMTGVDEAGRAASTGASTELPEPQDGQTFVAFEDLSEETVIGWIEDHTDACRGEGYLQERRDIIAAEIAAQINPPIVTGPPPWEPEPAPAGDA